MEVGARMGIQRRVPRPARASRRPGDARARVLGALFGVVVLTMSPGRAAPAAAATADPVLGPWVDALIVDGSPPDAELRLVAVAPPDPHEPGTIHLVLLDRGADTWSEVGRLDVQTGLAVAGAGRLVPLDGAIALVATDAEARRTFVTRVAAVPAGLSRGAATTVDLGSGGIGPADIDGDGSHELVLTGEALVVSSGDCRRTSLEVLDGRTLEPRTGPTVIGATLVSAAVGRLGGAGESIVALASPSCDADPAVPWASGIVTVDPTSGGTRLVWDLTGLRSTSSGVGPARPLPVDVDGDGSDEVVVRTGDGTTILEPRRDWRSTTLDDGAFPLAVARGATGPPVLAMFRNSDPGTASGPALDLRTLRDDGRGIALGVRSLSVPMGHGTNGDVPPLAIAQATEPSAPPPIWSGDLSGTGCTAMLVPGVTFQGCGPPSAWTQRSGPDWLATLPLASYGPTSARRLLVAAGLGWGIADGGGGLASPAPAASTLVRGSGWRTAPSSPFVLEELDASDVAYFPTFPVPAIDIDPNGGGSDAPRLLLGGTTGDRVFVRLAHADPPSPDLPVPATEYIDDPEGFATTSFLAQAPPAAASRTGVIPVPPSSTAGSIPGSVLLPLPLGSVDPAAPGGSGRPLAAAWRVTALGLNAYGVPSPMVSTLVAVDTTGPNVSIDPPFMSLPWPFSASLRGVAEPGATVSIGDGPFAQTTPTGAFEVRAPLAPWPQELAIRAVDDHGNVTVVHLDVIGGLDYRRLPWQTILVAATLLGAAITTWRGPAALRRVRVGPGSPGSPPLRPGSRAPGSIGDGHVGWTPAAGGGRSIMTRPNPVAEPVAEIEDLP